MWAYLWTRADLVQLDLAPLLREEVRRLRWQEADALGRRWPAWIYLRTAEHAAHRLLPYPICPHADVPLPYRGRHRCGGGDW